jgi:hypothetical protein
MQIDGIWKQESLKKPVVAGGKEKICQPPVFQCLDKISSGFFMYGFFCSP